MSPNVEGLISDALAVAHITALMGCGEVYELLGATGSQGELEELPDLSDEQIDNAYEKAEQNLSDPICAQLKDDLDAQANASTT